jgi:hypothetical protein
LFVSFPIANRKQAAVVMAAISATRTWDRILEIYFFNAFTSDIVFPQPRKAVGKM